MLDYLEKLRKKPLYYRKRVAVITAGAITFIILVIWYSTLNFDMGADVVSSKAVPDELKPLQQIKAGVLDFYAILKETSSEFWSVATSSLSNN